MLFDNSRDPGANVTWVGLPAHSYGSVALASPQEALKTAIGNDASPFALAKTGLTNSLIASVPAGGPGSAVRWLGGHFDQTTKSILVNGAPDAASAERQAERLKGRLPTWRSASEVARQFAPGLNAELFVSPNDVGGTGGPEQVTLPMILQGYVESFVSNMTDSRTYLDPLGKLYEDADRGSRAYGDFLNELNNDLLNAGLSGGERAWVLFAQIAGDVSGAGKLVTMIERRDASGRQYTLAAGLFTGGEGVAQAASLVTAAKSIPRVPGVGALRRVDDLAGVRSASRRVRWFGHAG